MHIYTTTARASTVKPRCPYPIFWKPDYSASGFAFTGLGGV